jgi:hypothetical protein
VQFIDAGYLAEFGKLNRRIGACRSQNDGPLPIR